MIAPSASRLTSLTIATTLALACVQSEEALRGELRSGRPQGVVLITVDTLRADHLASYGYPLETSPWMDSVAERAVVFRRAYAHSATTKPSHSSLFTSLYPFEHGVVKNSQILDQSFLTLAEVMRQAGYRTAGFVSTDVPLSGNLDQGFDHWDLPEWREPKEKRSLYRSAQDTVDLALHWIDSLAPGEEYFLWVHVYDPHNPLQPPADHLAAIETLAGDFGNDAHERVLRARDVPARAPKNYERIVLYDSEIRYADSQLERLERRLAERGMNDDALWIVTSDHGQGLGAHGWFGHGVHIYNAQLHVPLMFWFTDGLTPPAVVDDQLVEHVDVLPTLAAILDVDLGGDVRGASLVPLLAGQPVARRRSFAFAQRSEYAKATRNRLDRGNYEPGSRYSLQSLDFKYLYFTEGEDEFYDLRADPHELDNLIDAPEHGEAASLFARRVEALTASHSGAPVAEVPEEDMERLRDLGYIQ